jgi:oxygen-independent coproporphyrinogen III oxidase
VPESPGLYLHVPFCAAICPYCDFAVARGDAPALERFTSALIAEMARAQELRPAGAPPAPPFDTLYLGGGTPSHLEPRQLEAILGAARAALPIAADVWVVMEANPEDVTPAAVEAWRALGIAGLSLGVQSFDDGVLRFLGRRHRGEGARRAVEVALGAGFAWVSLDLIYGSPGGGGGGRADSRDPRGRPAWDPLAVALADVETAIALGPQHLSCYQLTVHDGTAFATARDRGRLRELSDDAQATLFLALHQALAAGGYPAYEVSNFAPTSEQRSRHNTKYWRHVPYLGLGPSAHSFDGATRWWNRRDWREWAAAIERGEPAVAGRETLAQGDLALEALMLGLRTVDGVATGPFRDRWGVDLAAANERLIESAVAEGLLELDNGRLAPTARGMAVADALAASFDLGVPTEAGKNESGRRGSPGAP